MGDDGNMVYVNRFEHLQNRILQQYSVQLLSGISSGVGLDLAFLLLFCQARF